MSGRQDSDLRGKPEQRNCAKNGGAHAFLRERDVIRAKYGADRGVPTSLQVASRY